MLDRMDGVSQMLRKEALAVDNSELSEQVSMGDST